MIRPEIIHGRTKGIMVRNRGRAGTALNPPAYRSTRSVQRSDNRHIPVGMEGTAQGTLDVHRAEDEPREAE